MIIVLRPNGPYEHNGVSYSIKNINENEFGQYFKAGWSRTFEKMLERQKEVQPQPQPDKKTTKARDKDKAPDKSKNTDLVKEPRTETKDSRMMGDV